MTAKKKQPLKRTEDECRLRKGQGLLEYAIILALVAASSILILAVVGGDVGAVFERINHAIGFTEDDLPPGTIEVDVLNSDDQGVAGAYVYAFDGQGNWTGNYERTDNQGIALFEEMEDGSYQFLAYESPHYYWSNTINFPKQNRATIKMNIHPFTISVVDGKGQGVEGVYVYAYTPNEKYWLGVYGRTGSDGKVTVDLPDGDYKFRAYYNGQWYWSPQVSSPAQSETVIDVQEYDVTVTVVDVAGEGVKESNLYVYAYTDSGSYTGIYGRTNGHGRVKLTVPAGVYQFSVYYRANSYWSDLVTVPDSAEAVIKTEERPFTVTVVDENDKPLRNVWVYPYTGDSAYVGLRGKTNKQGEVVFDLPRGEFKFRADYKGHSFWSAVISTEVTDSTTVTIK